MASIFRAPLFTGWRRPARSGAFRQDSLAVNLLLTVLAAAAIPFAQTDWPAASRHQLRRIEQALPALLQTTLAPPPAAVPFAQTDWPGTPRARRYPDAGPPSLQRLTEPAPAIPFAQSGWPAIARGAALRPDTLPPALLQTTLAPPAAAAPFAELRWPARIPVSRRHLDAPPPLLQGTLAAPPAAQAPFAQADWPRSSTSARRYLDLRPPNLALEAGTAVPFAQSDWPPARRGRRAEPFLISPPAIAAAPVPFAQSDWPRHAVARPYTDYQLSARLALTEPPGVPFAHSDWSRPPRPRRPLPWHRVNSSFTALAPEPGLGFPAQYTIASAGVADDITGSAGVADDITGSAGVADGITGSA